MTPPTPKESSAARKFGSTQWLSDALVPISKALDDMGYSLSAAHVANASIHLRDKQPAAGPESAKQHDYPEDFSDENGNYQHRCYSCGRLFVGHKRRAEICKACAVKSAPQVETPNRELLVAHVTGPRSLPPATADQTPRTDAWVKEWQKGTLHGPWHFCRDLERELTACQAELRAAKAQRGYCSDDGRMCIGECENFIELDRMRESAERRVEELTNERDANRDMLDDARAELNAVRKALGVSIEPHQSLHERIVEAALAKQE